MSRTMRMIGVLALAFFTVGCSSYGVVYGPGGEEIPEPVDWTEIVEHGEKVKVTFGDERSVEGKVLDLSADALVVEAKVRAEGSAVDDYESENITMTTPIEEVTIEAGEDIRSIEMPRFSWWKTLVLVGVIAAPFVVYGLTTDDAGLDLNTGFQK